MSAYTTRTGKSWLCRVGLHKARGIYLGDHRGLLICLREERCTWEDAEKRQGSGWNEHIKETGIN